MLDGYDFATVCLQFSGFIFMGILIKAYDLRKKPHVTCQIIVHEFTKYYYGEGHYKTATILHSIFRAANFFFYSWLLIISAAFATRAGINFGIISTCQCVQTPMNTVAGLLLWNERLSCKIIIGTIVILTGVIWIAFSRGVPPLDPI